MLMKKICLTLLFLMMSAVSFTIAASDYVRGDCNQDGTVNITDVTCLLDYLLSGNETGINLDAADTNQDGNITISDISSQLDFLLTGSWPDEPVTPPDSHTYVDLGLPSGTLWATCNIGASSPEEYGDYFAWGEIEPKTLSYEWSTYKWNGPVTYMALTKYCTSRNFGYNNFVDNKIHLDAEDDAAYVNWGPSWRMPNIPQIQELCSPNCTWHWTTLNGVNGQLVTGPNGNTIFLPASGYRYMGSLYDVGTSGSGWGLTIFSDRPSSAVYLDFGQNYWRCFYDYYRSMGRTVRPVRAQ